ncbi:hypothetical protein BJ165DRAFT_1409886 [Panaeolus papilionaceus]|nr:hypothetical protein BJ165DRAFT_1409886 [Panaeolus papilionaceus]
MASFEFNVDHFKSTLAAVDEQLAGALDPGKEHELLATLTMIAPQLLCIKLAHSSSTAIPAEIQRYWRESSPLAWIFWVALHFGELVEAQGTRDKKWTTDISSKLEEWREKKAAKPKQKAASGTPTGIQPPQAASPVQPGTGPATLQAALLAAPPAHATPPMCQVAVTSKQGTVHPPASSRVVQQLNQQQAQMGGRAAIGIVGADFSVLFASQQPVPRLTIKQLPLSERSRYCRRPFVQPLKTGNTHRSLHTTIMTDAAPSKNPQSFLNNTSLTKDLAFSLQSPFYTMFTHTKNDKLLDNFKSNGQLEDDFKVQNIVIYASFRLTQILQHGMDYARVVHVGESMRWLTWIQTGLLHELRYFLGYIGLAAASENVEWVDVWWMDTDFNIDQPLDHINKTTFISDHNLFDAMAQFWESYAAFKMAEHAALTEGDYPQTSRRSQWKMPQRPNDNWNDLYVGVRGRRWASTNPAERPAPGIDILGCMDNIYNREETRQSLARDGQDVESPYSSPADGLHPDQTRMESLAPIINKPISLAGARRPLPAPDAVTERPTESLSAWSRMRNEQPTGSANASVTKKDKKSDEQPVTSREPNWADSVQYGSDRLKKIMDDIDQSDEDDDMEGDDDTESDGGLAESDGGLASALAVTKMSLKPALAAAVQATYRAPAQAPPQPVGEQDDETEEEEDDNSFAQALVQATNRAAGNDNEEDGGDEDDQDDEEDDEEEEDEDEEDEDDGFANALLGK